jgi:hypothetical protein
MPTLPIEVVRLRVKRAAELGLPYKTYAGIRASTGHDLIGFMFSTNALRVLQAGQSVPEPIRSRIDALKDCAGVGLLHAGIAAQQIVPPLQAAHRAPPPLASWARTRDHLKSIVRQIGKPADRFVLVGDTPLEREWAEIVQAAGYLSHTQYFAPTHQEDHHAALAP